MKTFDMRPAKRDHHLTQPDRRQGAAARRSLVPACRASAMTLALAASIFSLNVVAQSPQFSQKPQLRLGNPQVLSTLGSPLLVKIPITVEGTEGTPASLELETSRFSLGVPPANAPVPFVERADITLET
ncbi:MAG: hypothetical protein ABL931_22910, partial [Usitatibacteraceae bacterium]